MHWIYRLIALIIDSVITGIVGYIIYIIVLPLFFTSTTVFGITVQIIPWWAGVFLLPFIYGLILVLYSVILEVSWGGMTLGKKLLGLQVQTTSGGKLAFDKAFIRNISKIYWLLLLDRLAIGNYNPWEQIAEIYRSHGGNNCSSNKTSIRNNTSTAAATSTNLKIYFFFFSLVLENKFKEL